MTRTYYTKRLLFVYVNLMNETRVFHHKKDILQEDSDKNHELD